MGPKSPNDLTNPVNGDSAFGAGSGSPMTEPILIPERARPDWDNGEDHGTNENLNDEDRPDE